MNQELSMEFKGGGSRQEFRRYFREQLASLINLRENKEFLLMLEEIIKNIYDHNSGYGCAMFCKIGDGYVCFKINNIAVSDKSKVILELARPKNDRINFGFGLINNGIKLIAQALCIDLHFDALAGFLYEGRYQLR